MFYSVVQTWTHCIKCIMTMGKLFLMCFDAPEIGGLCSFTGRL